MICVTVARGRHRMAQAEHQMLAEQKIPVDRTARVDFITHDVDIPRLLRDRPRRCW